MARPGPGEMKEGIRRNFARRAASYDEQAGMQRLMAHRLLALLPDRSSGGRILEIGCGTGYFTQLLRQAYPAARMIALDLDPALVHLARRRLNGGKGVEWLVADGETQVPGPFDLIAANAAFQWLTSPTRALATYYDNLAPEGLLAFSTLGPRTFQELADSLTQASGSLSLTDVPTIVARNFADRETWATLLGQAGFTHIELWEETVIATFPSVHAFLKSIQATGATNPGRPFSLTLLKAAIAAYNLTHGGNGSIPATYELIFGVARK